MRRFDNPLDNIRIASPCSANWDEMFGDDRKRFCGECKLNVYNLSNMNRRDAENLIINSEGRLCVQFFRRADGTILTENCPVGWQAVKKRVSRLATAAFSMVAGLLSGVVAFNCFQERREPSIQGAMIVRETAESFVPEVGEVPGVSKVDPADPEGGYERGRMVMGKPALRPAFQIQRVERARQDRPSK
jgi:hypothetical protein